MGRKKQQVETATGVELLVSFNNANIGDKTASIGIAIDRTSFSIMQANEMLCGHRINGTIVGRPVGNDADQPNLPTMSDDIVLATTFDVKSFRVAPRIISCSLVVNLASIKVESLAQFAKRNGKFIIHSVGSLPKDAPASPAQEGEDDEFQTTDE
jgi:hypothetical protein